MNTFDQLVASRRGWIEEILKPWCRRASLADLKRAELEWPDFAGRVDAEATLWTWAWGRFPDLVHDQFSGVSETHEVRVTLKNGEAYAGYPDNRKSREGRLVLATMEKSTRQLIEHGPWPIDQIASVSRLSQV